MFFALDNLSSDDVWPLEHPEAWAPSSPLPAFEDKAAFRRFCNDSATQHCFFSGIEGVTDTKRVSQTLDNAPHIIHAFVVDYDAPMTMEEAKARVEAGLPALDGLIHPQWASSTYSGNLRVCWVLEAPLRVLGLASCTRFLKHVMGRLKLDRWFPGFDKAGFVQPAHYYEIGRNWTRLSDRTVPLSLATLWLFEANRKADVVTEEYEVPLAVVAEEVEKRYPGRWQGAFQEGCRGVNFWDPRSTNPTAAVVHKQGMFTFSGEDGPFLPWAKIFGADFVRDYVASRIQSLRDKALHDEDEHYWVKVDGIWKKTSPRVFAQDLRCLGFKSQTPKGDTASEIDRVQKDIRDNCSITKALPFVHFPYGPIMHEGQRYLNISTVRSMAPATEPCDTDKFPWLWEFLRGYFEKVNDRPYTQLDVFLAWLQRFYKGGLDLEPKPGQAIVIAGPPGKGKDFLAHGIVGRMVGGVRDGTAYLVDAGQYSDEEVSVPLLTINDQLASADQRAHLRFTAMLKKTVASHYATFNGKWKQRGRVPWKGRVIITCNLDPESLRIIPNLEISILDKLCLFKAAMHNIVLPGFEEQEALMTRELPHFCRWLLDWKPPSSVLSKNPRFGTVAFHHPDLLGASNQSTLTYMVKELIVDFVEDYQKANPSAVEWKGRATELHGNLDAKFPSIVRKFSPQMIGISLSRLASMGYPVITTKYRGNTVYALGFDWDVAEVTEITEESKDE